MLQEDFTSDMSTGLGHALLKNEHASLAKGAGRDGSDAVRIRYVGNGHRSDGVVLYHPLLGTALEATFSFDVRFDPDFQWTRGGKLLGFGPKRPVTGGRPRQPDGWSARIVFNKDGHCSSYLYDQSKGKKYGISRISPRPVFTKGHWHRVVLKVGLNDPGSANGFAGIEVDRQEVVRSEGILFRELGDPDTLIQTFLFSTFHGGSGPQWSPLDSKGQPTTVFAYFDNLLVTRGIQA